MTRSADRPSPTDVPEPPGAAGHAPRDRLLRGGLIAVCLLLAAAAAAGFVGWRSARDGALEILRTAGLDVRAPRTFAEISRERTPHHARLDTARALVRDVLELDAEADGATREERIARLAVARDLARRALREQPNSWRATMLIGASVYLERSLRADPRLFTAHADWEVPLRKAVADAGGRTEPQRFLIAAYLECWPALSEEKKGFARALMKEIFRRSPEVFARLVAAWIEAAPGPDEAFELIPDRPEAWRQLGGIYAARRDWSSFCRVHARRLDALERRHLAELEEVEKRLRLGDLENSRSLCLHVITSAPPSLRFAPLATRALELYPPGLHALRSTEPLAEWRRFVLELDALGIEPLSPRAMSRLSDAIGEIRTPEAAHAALYAGDSYRLGQAERLGGTKSTAAWAPFLIARARRQLAGGPGEAARTLSQVGRAARSGIFYWRARYDVGRALGDQRTSAEAAAELERLRARQWSALEWRLRGPRAFLELLPAAAASGLTLELKPRAPTGAAVEVLWDGAVVAMLPVRRGQKIDLSVTVEPRPHLLEVRSLARQGVVPVLVRLADGSGGPATGTPPSAP